MTPQEIHDKALEYMRTLYDADPSAVHALLVNRVPTNQAMIDHPTAVCDAAPIGGGPLKYPTIGMLGVLNGLLGSLGLANDQLLAVAWDNSDPFEPRFVGFRAYTPPQE